MNIRTANERLRVAHALQQLPKITEAFAAGRLSYSKVRAISRVVGSDSATLTRMAAEIAAGTSDLKHTTMADPETAEKILLTLALGGTAGHLETVVRAVRRRHTPAGDTAARRSLTWTWDDDGSLIVRARLTPDAGAAFIHAIDARVPKRQPVTARTEPVPRDLDEQAREQGTRRSARPNRGPARRCVAGVRDPRTRRRAGGGAGYRAGRRPPGRRLRHRTTGERTRDPPHDRRAAGV
jgi:hypothetical protein